MMNKSHIALFLAIALSALGGLARAALPMPPVFSLDAPVEQALRSYLLGAMLVAFNQHGKAHREIKLPNGLEGWVYDVGGLPKATPYVSPTGKKQTVRETEAAHEARGYVLVFDSRGVAADVRYKENGRHDGLAALGLPTAKGAARMEEHPHPGPGR